MPLPFALEEYDVENVGHQNESYAFPVTKAMGERDGQRTTIRVTFYDPCSTLFSNSLPPQFGRYYDTY